MGDIGREIRELFDEVADPIDIRAITAKDQRRGWRGWQIALAAGAAALLVVGGVVLLGSLESPPVAGPSNTTPSEDLPYLGLDLEGWVVTLAGEGTGGCGAGDAIGVARQASYQPITPRDEGPIHINVGVRSAEAFCDEPMADDAADLGPPADPPFVNDHGFIEVMGHRARVLDSQGTFEVRWLIGSLGAGHIHIFGNNLTPEDAIAIAGHVVQLGAPQWNAILESFPGGGTTTTIAPDGVTSSTTAESPRVIGILHLESAPTVLECAAAPGTDPETPPTQGADTQLAIRGSLWEALADFLSSPHGSPPIATNGYLQIVTGDGKVILAKPFDEQRPEAGFVTLIFMERIGDGWSVTRWEGSGC